MTTISSLLDAFSAGSFKSEGGQTIYFPYGVWGRGYVVPDAGKLAEIKGRLRCMMGILFCSIPFVSMAFNYVLDVHGRWTGAAFLGFVTIMAQLASVGALRGLVKGLTVSQSRLDYKDALSRQAKAQPRWVLLFPVVVFGLILVGGLWMLVEASGASERGEALAVSAVGLSFLTLAVAILRLRDRT